MNRSLRRLLCPQYSVLIIGRSLPHLKGDRPGGTSRQAVTQTIAVILSGQLRLAIYHLNGPFVAGFRANSAAIKASSWILMIFLTISITSLGSAP